MPSHATKTALEFLKWFVIWYAESWCVYIQEWFLGNPLCLFWGRSDKLEWNTLWYMNSVWNLITFSLCNEIPLQWVCVHILIILQCHYLSVIHCLAITLLVCFFSVSAFCKNAMSLAKQESFFSEAKIKIGDYHISSCMCQIALYKGELPTQMKSGAF